MGCLEFQLGHDLRLMQGPAVLAVIVKHFLANQNPDGGLRLALPQPGAIFLGLTVQADVVLADHITADAASQGKWLVHWHILELVG